jgi:hypothetical protein
MMRLRLIAFALLFTILSPATAAEPVVVVKAAPVDPGPALTAAGWRAASIQLQNTAGAPLTGALLAEGYDQSYPPKLLGTRLLPPTTLDGFATASQEIHLPAAWQTVEFTFSAPSGEAISFTGRGETMIQSHAYGMRFAEQKRIGIVSADPAWSAAVMQIFNYRALNVSTGGNTIRFDAYIYDLARPLMDTKLLEAHMRAQVDAGMPVLVVTRAGTREVDPGIMKILCGDPGESRLIARLSIFDRPSAELILHAGRKRAYLLIFKNYDLGNDDGQWRLQQLLNETAFNEYLNTNQNADRLVKLERALFRIIRSRPPFLLFALILALHALILIPGTYVVLTILKRRDLAWMLLPAYGIGLTVIILGIGLGAHGRTDRIAVWEIVRHDRPDLDADTGLWQNREVAVACFAATFRPVRFSLVGGDAAAQLVDFTYGGSHAAGPLRIAPMAPAGISVTAPILFWSARSLRLASFSNAPARPLRDTMTLLASHPEVYRIEDGVWRRAVPAGPGGWEFHPLRGEDLDPTEAAALDRADCASGRCRVVGNAPDEEQLLREITALPSTGRYWVACDSGLPEDLGIPSSAKIIQAHRVSIWREE